MKRYTNLNRNIRRAARHQRVRAGLSGTAECPRISVFRGLKRTTVQFIDDVKRTTLCAASSAELKSAKAQAEGKKGKVAQAYLTGKLAAEKAKEKGIKKAVFDRGGYRYHGRIAAVADGIREAGIKF